MRGVELVVIVVDKIMTGYPRARSRFLLIILGATGKSLSGDSQTQNHPLASLRHERHINQRTYTVSPTAPSIDIAKAYKQGARVLDPKGATVSEPKRAAKARWYPPHLEPTPLPIIAPNGE